MRKLILTTFAVVGFSMFSASLLAQEDGTETSQAETMRERRQQMMERRAARQSEAGEQDGNAQQRRGRFGQGQLGVNAEDGRSTESMQQWREQMRKRMEENAKQRELKEGQVRSITYKLNDEEVTKYYSVQKSEAGVIRIVETNGAGGDVVPKTTEITVNEQGEVTDEANVTRDEDGQVDISSEWIMAEFGYKKNESVTGEEGADASNTVIGPDGNFYVLNTEVTSMRRRRSEAGPNGEQVVSNDLWTKTETGYEKAEPAQDPRAQFRQRNAARNGEGAQQRVRRETSGEADQLGNQENQQRRQRVRQRETDANSEATSVESKIKKTEKKKQDI